MRISKTEIILMNIMMFFWIALVGLSLIGGWIYLIATQQWKGIITLAPATLIFALWLKGTVVEKVDYNENNKTEINF